MKTLKMFSPGTLVKICLSLCFILAANCAKPDYEELTVSDPIADQKENNWVALLEELSFESSIIVGKESSLGQALNEARPGDALFIEPGIYEEALNVNKPGVKLFGLTGENGEKVILTNPGNTKIITIQDAQATEKTAIGLSQESKSAKKRICFKKITRSEIGNGIAHYQMEVRLGKNEYDVVRIHRVVREKRPFRPVRTEGAIFMIHGASQDFDDIFLRPGVDKANAQNSSPVYLASNNIDVWGIDLAWTLVPVETSDFSFMQDWGIERDVDHVLASMSIARLIRGLTHQGCGRLNLLGFSYGVSVAYAAAGKETKQPRCRRDIKGLIAAEGLVKYAPEDEAFRLAACDQALIAREALDNGIYQNNNGVVFSQVGDLAALAPDEDSPFVPGLTNYQFALFAGTVPGANPPAPFWHFWGGEFDENNIPIGLLYTKPERLVNLLRVLAPYQPILQGFETTTSLCDEQDVRLYRNLGEISVPILYLGVAGGYGQQGLYSSSLTRSKDITHHMVSLQPPELRAIDYGHADLLMGENANDLAWDVLRKWLVNHSLSWHYK